MWYIFNRMATRHFRVVPQIYVLGRCSIDVLEQLIGRDWFLLVAENLTVIDQADHIV